MTSSVPRSHRIGGLGESAARLVIRKWTGARNEPWPVRHLRRGTWIVVVAGPRRQHRLHEDVDFGRDEGRLHIVGKQHLSR
jgi:hypothetical protein